MPLLTQLALLAVVYLDNAAAWPAGVALVDLSHPFHNSTIYWPGVKHFSLENVIEGVQAQGFWLELNNFAAAEHGGTHMDAPSHFVRGRWTIDQVPLENLGGPAVVVDISARAATDRDTEVYSEDLLAWESAHGRIPDGAIVFMFSDWARRWPDQLTYLGNAEQNASDLHFPGFSLEAVEWLTTNRDIIGIGTDTASAEHGPSLAFPVHVHLLGLNKFSLENVNNLHHLPPVGATVFAFPMKIQGGTGAPCRTVAMVPTTSAVESSARVDTTSSVFLIVSVYCLMHMVAL